MKRLLLICVMMGCAEAPDAGYRNVAERPGPADDDDCDRLGLRPDSPCPKKVSTPTEVDGLITSGDGGSWTVEEVRAAQRSWVFARYPNAVYVTGVQCNRVSIGGHPATQCSASIEVFGVEYYVYCDAYDEGALYCDSGCNGDGCD